MINYQKQIDESSIGWIVPMLQHRFDSLEKNYLLKYSTIGKKIWLMYGYQNLG